jgi:hypothetical protein
VILAARKDPEPATQAQAKIFRMQEEVVMAAVGVMNYSEAEGDCGMSRLHI